ncbi:hypothetical protein BAE44_0019769 [Dichanthelium oligosanthes]|uniref:Uncharacterized protein n=1 Tax=Dichanthelium oligosanthes TaxID=888268 RepID=A0A1E5V227_9POAL|nr:hypothetical protein BAE44_0019769 [Dichanthelium oligosanthes]
MEDGDESAAAAEAEAEAALGLSPQLFVDEVLDIIADVSAEAFEYCLQLRSLRILLSRNPSLDFLFCFGVLSTPWSPTGRLVNSPFFPLPFFSREAATPGVLGAATAAQKAADLQRDNSCAKESRKDGMSDSDLDVELDSLRRKLESANKESENLQREMSSLERQTTYKRKLDSAIAEIQKLFEDKFVQENFEDLAKAIPVLQQKIIGVNKKRTETGSLLDEQVCNTNGPRDNKRQALGKCNFPHGLFGSPVHRAIPCVYMPLT